MSSCGALYNAILDVKFDETGATEPVTVEELKAFARIDGDTEDDLIEELGITARQACEAYTNISFVRKEVTAIINNSLGSCYLPYGPVIGDVTSVKDDNGKDFSDPVIKGNKFKYLKLPDEDYVEVVYTAGYAAGELPKNLKTSVLNWFAYLYENRGDEKTNENLIEAKRLLKPYSRVS